ITNYYGDYTVSRVKAFQKQHNLPQSGMIDSVTEQKINTVFTNTYKQGGNHSKVAEMKKKLNALGFGHITVTDLYGSFTVTQVKKFQKQYGLKQTGTANLATLKKIDKLYKTPLQYGKKSNKL